jgi:PilZ domain-containing protein
MRAARNPKHMSQSESTCGESAGIKKLSAQAASTIVDTPSWTTRAKPKGIFRVPTHAVRPVKERRGYARAKLSLPLRLKRVAGKLELKRQALRTTDISSSGVLFLCPQRIEPGTPIEIEVCLVSRPSGQGTVRMMTEAHIVRAEPASKPGWHALAASFDDITFQRDEPLPPGFERA